MAKFVPTANPAAKKRLSDAALAFAVASLCGGFASASFAEDTAPPPSGPPAWYQPDAGFANWSLSLGGMSIRRAERENYVLTVNGASNPIGPASHDLRGLGSGLPGTADLQGDWRGVGLELRGMYVESAGSSGAFSSPIGAGLLFANTAQGLFSPSLNATTTRNSQFGSIEGNIGTSVAAPLRAFVGARYIKVTDVLDYGLLTTNGAFDASETISARNSMFGPQVGLQGTLRQLAGLPVDLSLTAKAAILRDSVFIHGDYLSRALNISAVATGSGSLWVPMGELAVDVIWHALPKLDFSVGYDVISLGHVATAPATQHYNNATLLAPAMTVATRDAQVYQGVTLKSILHF